MASLNDDFLLVAAIDFGTAYSGYAFSYRTEFSKDPLKVRLIRSPLVLAKNLAVYIMF